MSKSGDMLMKKMLDHIWDLSEKERLVYAARLLWRSKYDWGGEMIGGTDCSGSVFFGLYLLSYDVRVTADELYRTMTAPLSRAPEAGDLAFWFRPGEEKVRHVALFSDMMMILDADKQFIDVPVGEEIQARFNQRFEARELDMDAVSRISALGTKAHGVDPELRALRGLFMTED